MDQTDILALGGGGILTVLFTLFMIAITVIPTLLITGGALFFVYKLMSRMNATKQERLALMRTGLPARAHIRTVAMGQMTAARGIHRSLQVILELEVQEHDHPQRGPQPAYTTQLTTMVPELAISRIQPQQEVPVRVDPDDPQKIAIDLLSMGYADADKYY